MSNWPSERPRECSARGHRRGVSMLLPQRKYCRPPRKYCKKVETKEPHRELHEAGGAAWRLSKRQTIKSQTLPRPPVG